MRLGSGAAAVAILGMVAFGSAEAQTVPAEARRPALLDTLLSCRALDEAEARLACFDSAAAAFETAERQGEVAVVDRAQARETRTRLFGFNLNTANLFSGLRQDDPIEAVETVLTSARQDQDGKWIFVLEQGATWRQIDSERLTPRPRPGASVRVRQAALGSYMLSVGGARSLRVRREQ